MSFEEIKVLSSIESWQKHYIKMAQLNTNKTILGHVRCMLLGVGFPKSGKPVDYSNLKFFEVLAFAHINQDKLDARVVKCIFICYLVGVKGYKQQKIEHKISKFIIGRDVIVDETQMGMNYKDLENSDSKTGFEKTQFEVDPSTSKTRD